jgi:hypothetical protein
MVLLRVLVLLELPELLMLDFELELPPVADALPPVAVALLVAKVLDGDVVVLGGISHSKVKPCTVTTLPGASPVPVPLVPAGTCTRMSLPVQFHARDIPQLANISTATARILRIVSPLVFVDVALGF